MNNHISSEITVNENAVAEAMSAGTLLKNSGIGILDAARLVLELTENGRTKKLKKLRHIFNLGCEEFSRERRSRSFYKAFRCFLESKSHLRERTLQDYRKVRDVILRKDPRIFGKSVCTVSAEFCRELLSSAFGTPCQRAKARAVLHDFFRYCLRRNWCARNPIASICPPVLKEREIVPLNLEEISALFLAAKNLNGGECVPAIALMLFAGIRPREIERLSWRAVDLEEKTIVIQPMHSKTGGTRHVSISDRLGKILEKHAPGKKHNTPLCPPNWTRKWKKIRRAAGWSSRENPWPQDVLRHTFASYHFKFFKNILHLQGEMGHSSARLLRSRYLSMRGITSAAAEEFWLGDAL